MNILIMTRLGIFVVILFIAQNMSFGQSNYYKIDWNKDAYILGGGMLFWGGTFFLKANSDRTTVGNLALLNRLDIWGFDRGATTQHSANAKTMSDYILFGSVSLPFLMMADKDARKEGMAIGLMSLEAVIISNGITNFLKATTKRYRPYTYNAEVSLDEKLNQSSRFSFVSGHTSNVAALSFLSAKVLSDLHPDSKLKPLFWTVGATLPAVAGYLRYKSGKHFPSDVIIGYAIGAAVGYTIPIFHRNKNLDLIIGEYGDIGVKWTF